MHDFLELKQNIKGKSQTIYSLQPSDAHLLTPPLQSVARGRKPSGTEDQPLLG